MIEFQEEELTRNDICWGDSDDNLYIFNKDGKGKIFHDIDNTKDAFNLAWKINKSGILIIKSMVDKETYYFKIIKQESDYFECEKYIKNHAPFSKGRRNNLGIFEDFSFFAYSNSSTSAMNPDDIQLSVKGSV